MRKIARLKTALVVLIASACLTACEKEFDTLMKNPAKLSGKVVTIEGSVDSLRTIPGNPQIAGGSFFRVKKSADDSDGVWVFRGPKSVTKGIPVERRTIKVTGLVQLEATYQGQKYAAVIEEQSGQQEAVKDAPGTVTW